MNKYLIVLLTALSLTLISGQSFAGSGVCCGCCVDRCGNYYGNYYRSAYDYVGPVYVSDTVDFYYYYW